MLVRKIVIKVGAWLILSLSNLQNVVRGASFSGLITRPMSFSSIETTGKLKLVALSIGLPLPSPRYCTPHASQPSSDEDTASAFEYNYKYSTPY